MEEYAVLDFRCTHRSQSTPWKLHSPSSITLNWISRVFVLTSISTANSLMSKSLIICWTPSTPFLCSCHRLDAGYCLLGGRARQRAVDILTPPPCLSRSVSNFFLMLSVSLLLLLLFPATRALDIFVEKSSVLILSPPSTLHSFPLGHTLGGAPSEVIQPKQALALSHSSIKMLLYYCRNYKSTADLGVMRVVE